MGFKITVKLAIYSAVLLMPNAYELPNRSDNTM